MTTPGGGAGRRTYLDLLRGVATLVMIEAHVIDSWTREADRQLHYYRQSMVLGGFAAPLFLFVAGIAVAMSVQSKARKLGDQIAAARLVRKRGVQIFLLAFVFRFQSFVLSHGAPWTLLKVDILNIMGLAIAGSAILCGVVRGVRGRVFALSAVTAAIVLVSPFVRAQPWLAALPDSVEGYIRPIPNLTNFSIFPWAAFLTAGAAIGFVLDAARTPSADRRANLLFGAAGAALAFVAWRMSWLPPIDPRSQFWSTSASFFFIRLGVMIAALGALYVWDQRPWKASDRWSPLKTFGRSSLFIYWIHVEIVYGLVSLPLHRAFSLTGAWIALGLFCGLMLLCALAKERFVARRRGRGGAPQSRPAVSPSADGLASAG